MISLKGIVTRIERLNTLTGSLSRELLIIRQGNDPLLYRDRRDYMKALGEAISGLETARIVLAKAKHRLDLAERYLLATAGGCA
jgi:hypothetical protein